MRRGGAGDRQKRSTGGCRLCYTIVATRWMELIKRYRFSRPLVLPRHFPSPPPPLPSLLYLLGGLWGSNCRRPVREGLAVFAPLLPLPRLRYDPSVPPTRLVPTPFHFAAGIAKLSADIRKYREREYLEDPRTFHGEGNWGEEEEEEGRTGTEFPDYLSPCWPAALKTSSNEAEDGYRDSSKEASEGWEGRREGRT